MTVVWIVAAIVLGIVLVVIAVRSGRANQERRSREAGALRDRAELEHAEANREHAAAAEQAARAERESAEAEERALRARRQSQAAASREKEAARIDPDREGDASEGDY
jgi:hypothetical protein